jgi:hypothetical protein
MSSCALPHSDRAMYGELIASVEARSIGLLAPCVIWAARSSIGSIALGTAVRFTVRSRLTRT